MTSRPAPSPRDLLRPTLVFPLGSAGVMLGFYGAADFPHHHPVIGALLVLAGVMAFVSSFRLAPTDDSPQA